MNKCKTKPSSWQASRKFLLQALLIHRNEACLIVARQTVFAGNLLAQIEVSGCTKMLRGSTCGVQPDTFYVDPILHANEMMRGFNQNVRKHDLYASHDENQSTALLIVLFICSL